MKTWGLYDTKDHCWLGLKEDAGPKTYSDHLHARAAATILSEQLGYLVIAKKILRVPHAYKDTVTSEISAEEAVKRIEAKVKSHDN